MKRKLANWLMRLSHTRRRLIPSWVRFVALAVCLTLRPMFGGATGDIKMVYAASSALTITLASLASSSTWVTGQESTAVDNTTNLYEDYLLAGKITTGTTPTTATEIRVYVVGLAEDSTYPDVFDGTDSAETWTTTGIRDSAARLAGRMEVTATSNVTYWFGPVSVAALFGGTLPKKFVVFVAQNTAVALNATSSNHALWITPMYQNVAA